MLRVHIFIITFITIIYPIVCNRKYDIETEALKLYGEDLATVLKRFRRTPDYLSILKDRLNDMQQHFGDVGLQILHFYINKIKGRVTEELGVTTTASQITTTPPSYFKRFQARRQGGEDPPGAPPVPLTSEEQRAKNEKESVSRLDSYDKLNSLLTVAERNSFRDLGFEFAGFVIHGVIKNTGPEVKEDEEGPSLSTKGILSVDQEESTVTTTEHVSVHEVTTTEHTGETSTASPAEGGTTPEGETTPGGRQRKGRNRLRA